MKYIIEIKNKTKIKKIKKLLNKLNIMYVKSNEKVAYYYEDLNTGNVFSFNESMTFYAASTIKILVLIYLYDKNIDLKEKITITAEDIKQGSGFLKFQNLPKEYSLEELLQMTIKFSDNTAYLKIVDFIGRDKLINYGKDIKAIHTLEGKDNFGITSCHDMKIYWQKIYEIIKNKILWQEWFLNPEYQIIKSKNIKNQVFWRKYGSFDIAYHECGVVISDKPYLLLILTQKGENKKAKKFINKTAKILTKVHFINNKTNY